ncbi:SGNH/GDSL hydrolase family protein [Halobacillus amylolyticus]|uniref:SGNH/GDSL hydrolase family protein n=1 Tax=Halobacillus amylolyticus TaxID=2932259 RepID=A0ABY4H822_9BACI|nr:SGNH/GDSL hydrolase family protein [Halobacillus amylolyticus]UOR10942.1 SGNH/GDSL hydrolase family protein [Halobacillus amylolyticus]
MRIITTLLCVSLFFIGSLLAPQPIHARESEQLVAIGDSIPYGYNLTKDNTLPSGGAFPYIIGNEADLEVTNLGVPGLTSAELLAAVRSNDKFRSTLKDADYVVVNIGGNDLLNLLKENKGLKGINMEEVALVVRDLIFNVYSTIIELERLTQGEILVYNIYNPYPEAGDKLDTPLSYINTQYSSLIELLSHFTNVKLVNAYQSFRGHPEYIIKGDVHPTRQGQNVLARLGLKHIKD